MLISRGVQQERSQFRIKLHYQLFRILPSNSTAIDKKKNIFST